MTQAPIVALATLMTHKWCSNDGSGSLGGPWSLSHLSRHPSQRQRRGQGGHWGQCCAGPVEYVSFAAHSVYDGDDEGGGLLLLGSSSTGSRMTPSHSV